MLDCPLINKDPFRHLAWYKCIDACFLLTFEPIKSLYLIRLKRIDDNDCIDRCYWSLIFNLAKCSLEVNTKSWCCATLIFLFTISKSTKFSYSYFAYASLVDILTWLWKESIVTRKYIFDGADKSIIHLILKTAQVYCKMDVASWVSSIFYVWFISLSMWMLLSNDTSEF